MARPAMAACSQQDKRVIAFPTTAAEPQVAWDKYDHIAPGTYPAFSRSARIYRDPAFRRWQCVVHFDILDASLQQVIARLAWFLNLGTDDKPHAGRRGNYWAAWCDANGSPPKRSDRLTPRTFERRHATVVVEDVKKDFQGRSLEQPAYSKVARVLSWNTGGRL
jgi:hypothetical protein